MGMLTSSHKLSDFLPKGDVLQNMQKACWIKYLSFEQQLQLFCSTSDCWGWCQSFI